MDADRDSDCKLARLRTFATEQPICHCIARARQARKRGRARSHYARMGLVLSSPFGSGPGRDPERGRADFREGARNRPSIAGDARVGIAWTVGELLANGLSKSRDQDMQRAEALLREVFDQDPRRPNLFFIHYWLGHDHLLLAQADEAVESLMRARSANPCFPSFPR